MAKLVEKVVYMSHPDIIRYQLMVYCFTKRIKLSKCDLDCLTLLGMLGETELADFCSDERVSDEKIRHEQWYKDDYKDKGKKKGLFGSAQSARNFLNRQEEMGLIVKEGKGRKKIQLNPDLEVHCDGSMVINYKMAYIEN